MKIDNNTLLLIGAGLIAYHLFRPRPIGGNCASTHGPNLDYVDEDGNCILKEPQVAGGNCGSTCGGYENPNYNSALPYSASNKPCICEGPGTANPYPKSQADCPPDTMFEVPMTVGMGSSLPPQCTPCNRPKSADDCPKGTTYGNMSVIMNWVGPPPPCGFGWCQPNSTASGKVPPLRPKSQKDCAVGLTFQPAVQVNCIQAPCPPGIPAKCV